MILSPQETERFYRIWWPLLNYVNTQQQIAPDFPATPEQGSINPQDAQQIRRVLWETEALREAFITENPAQLSAADLELVASWRYRIAGKFLIFRYLKNYTIFLTEQCRPPQAYGVLGLVSPIAEVVPWPPPVMVDAVLLPFADKIIYDGLISHYAIHFGSGIRRGFKENYRAVQERGGVITTLQPLSAEEINKRIQSGNHKVLAAFRKDLAVSGLSTKMIDQHVNTIAVFTDAYLAAQHPPRLLLDITAADLQTYLDQQGKKGNPVSFKRLVRFLVKSGRIEWQAGETMQNLLR